MNILFKYTFVFIFCSTCGYFLEVIYRSLKSKHMVNPGFLVGPCLPLYGIGGCTLFFICSLELSFIKSSFLKVLFIIFIATILMTVIEYIAGLISIKIFHNRLWDYSDRWGNIQGIICPTFSCAWGLICFAFYFFIFPWLKTCTIGVSSNIWGIFFMGIYLGVFFVDLGYSIDVLSKIRDYSIKFKELVSFEKLKSVAQEKYKTRKGKKLSTYSFNLYNKMKLFLEERKVSANKNKDINEN